MCLTAVKLWTIVYCMYVIDNTVLYIFIVFLYVLWNELFHHYFVASVDNGTSITCLRMARGECSSLTGRKITRFNCILTGEEVSCLFPHHLTYWAVTTGHCCVCPLLLPFPFSRPSCFFSCFVNLLYFFMFCETSCFIIISLFHLPSEYFSYFTWMVVPHVVFVASHRRWRPCIWRSVCLVSSARRIEVVKVLTWFKVSLVCQLVDWKGEMVF